MTDEYARDIIRSRIEELRIKEGMSRRELSLAIGMNHSYISNFCTGLQDTMDILQAVRIAKYFGVSTDYLLGITDDSTSKEEEYVELDIRVLNEKIAEYNLKKDKLESIKYAVDQMEHMYSKRGYLKKISEYIRDYDEVDNTPIDKLNTHGSIKEVVKKHFATLKKTTNPKIKDVIPLFQSGEIKYVSGLGPNRIMYLRRSLIEAGVEEDELDGDY